jgi:hypothetical protein
MKFWLSECLCFYGWRYIIYLLTFLRAGQDAVNPVSIYPFNGHNLIHHITAV